MPRIALIIVTYNSEKFLPELLLSLKKMKQPEGWVQIIIVDNASSDGTVAYLTAANRDQVYGQGIALPVQIVSQTQNLGFSVAVNAGIRSSHDAEYIALLNPDTVVTEDWLTELVQALDTDNTIASAQPLLLYNQNRGVINSSGNAIHFLGFGFTFGNGTKLTTNNLQLKTDIAYASGAAVLYRKKYLEEIALFDEDLFMYHDDLDVGWKFILRGYINVLVPTSIVYHHYEFSRSIQKYYWMERNRLMILFTHYRYRTLLLILPALFVLELGLTLFSIIRGFFMSRLRAYMWLFQHSALILRKHRTLQQLRAVGDHVIMGKFTGIISHQEISNPVVEWVMNPLFSLYLTVIKSLIPW